MVEITDANLHNLVNNYITNKNLLPDDLKNIPIGNWDVSRCTNFSNLFFIAQARTFNEPLNNWNTSNVTDMSRMFRGCFNFNQPLDNWDTSNVIDMSIMFFMCKKFNQPLNNWDTSNVTNMSYMFGVCFNFNQPLNNWDTSNVTNMSTMFSNCSMFNQPLDNWDTSNVTDMSSMFIDCAMFNHPLNNWDTSNVTDMSSMFDYCAMFNQPLNNWDTSNVTNMSSMFIDCAMFNQPLNNWDISNVENVENLDDIFDRSGMTDENMPLIIFQNQNQNQNQNQYPAGIAYEIHNSINKINFNKLNDFLKSKIHIDNISTNINFPKFIKETITQLINNSANDNNNKTTLLQQLQNIMDQRLNGYNYKGELKPIVLTAIVYSLEYTKLQSTEFKQMYVETFIKDCVTAYSGDGANAMSCAKGAVERVITSLINGCMTDTENPDYAKLIEIIESNPEKVIMGYILDWYKLHSANKFPEETTVERKKANLKAYLLNLLPESEELINSKINDGGLDFEDDAFGYNGGKRRKTLKRRIKEKRKKNVKTRSKKKGKKTKKIIKMQKKKQSKKKY